MRPTPVDVAVAAQLACLLEVTAPKPGNVSPGQDFRDTRYEDFLASAAAIGPALATAGHEPLGRTIRTAVEATQRWANTNTNLGIVLLLAPLARAALRQGGGLRERVTAVLAESTIADATETYAAIRAAAPGGLGTVVTEDVRAAPSVTLRGAMALAANRDTVAREYATDFSMTFGVGAPALIAARTAGLPWADAIVQTFLTLLATAPDTLIARKLGEAAAGEVTRRAGEVLRAGGVRGEAGRRQLAAFDAELRDAENTRNPGTTADLTCAAAFVVILEGYWQR